MPGEPDPKLIAARLRALLAGLEAGDLSETAARLNVSEVALRMSIDEQSPRPTIDVIVAVVHEYGIDPSWLVTGDYDWSVHQRALGEGAEPASRAEVAQLVLGKLAPMDNRSAPRADLRLEA